MSPVNWDGSAPRSAETECVREVATGVPGLSLTVTAIGATDLAVRVTGAERLLLVEAEPLGTDEARIRVAWRLPCTGATALWRPETDHRWLPPGWRAPRVADLAAGAPIGSLIGTGDAALCTFALGEQLRPVTIGEGVVEETGEFSWWAEHAVAGAPLRLRLDLTRRHFADTLGEMVEWWGAGELPAVPAAAFAPVFCTWYVRHLEITAAEVERLAALAAPLGFGAVIVDDGWQTPETTRSYATTGDWQPAEGPFPDFAGHVARVRALGLAYLLWVALPFAGDRSAAGKLFAAQRLHHDEELETSVVDPGDVGVRAHLARRLARLVEEYRVDGLKIDFIDTFARHATDRAAVAAGVRELLAELDRRLRGPRPELLIEHRQPYTGPGLWRHATMVRATDCPHSPAENRARTADLRLTAGPLAVHADPLTWHPDEDPVDIAVLFQSVLFATAQVSVDLGRQHPEQLAVLRFWLAVQREHLDLLQRGGFRPHRPELGYPLLEARGAGQLAFGRYAPLPIPVAGPWQLLLVANADPDPVVRLRFERPPGRLRLQVHDCAGAVLTDAEQTVTGPEFAVSVPRGGLLTLKALAPGADQGPGLLP
ncbi:glycoside hydrolase family 36 protein [Kitasatospora sp. LaBMicrA B282]|uniref:glycoside hydrolase family 36 protein n=1 Tax=Kitasatospora sp. LaBMicrA B282 TaxID=3420949 RepID=UPI003D0E7E6D